MGLLLDFELTVKVILVGVKRQGGMQIGAWSMMSTICLLLIIPRQKTASMTDARQEAGDYKSPLHIGDVSGYKK